MSFTGSDLLNFLQEVLYDLLHLGDADLLSLGFRLLLLFFWVVIFFSIGQSSIKISKRTFGSLLRWLFDLVSTPYRIPRNAFRRWYTKKRFQKARRKQEQEEAKQRLQRTQEQMEREKREREAFEKIMNQ